MSTPTNVREQLIRDEGMRRVPYQDSKGYLTLGVGHKITTPLSDRAINVILDDDIEAAETDCRSHFFWYERLSECRKAVIVGLRFNCGMTGLLEFRRMIAALMDEDYQRAANEILDSELAPLRARRFAQQMREDTWQ